MGSGLDDDASTVCDLALVATANTPRACASRLLSLSPGADEVVDISNDAEIVADKVVDVPTDAEIVTTQALSFEVVSASCFVPATLVFEDSRLSIFISHRDRLPPTLSFAPADQLRSVGNVGTSIYDDADAAPQSTRTLGFYTNIKHSYRVFVN